MFLFVFYWSLLKVMQLWTHKILTKKYFGSTKQPRKNIRTHENTMTRWYETHDIHDGRDPWKLAHSPQETPSAFLFKLFFCISFDFFFFFFWHASDLCKGILFQFLIHQTKSLLLFFFFFVCLFVCLLRIYL